MHFFYSRSSTGTDSWLMGFLPFPLIVVMFMAHALGINNIIHLTTSEVQVFKEVKTVILVDG